MGGEVGKGGCQACTRPTSSRACPPPRPAVAATLAEIANTTGSALSPTAQGVAQRVEDSLGVVALLLAAAEEGALAGAGVNAPLAESAPHFQMTPAPENTPRSRRLLGTLSLGMSQGNYSAATYSISTGTDRATSVVRGVLCGGGGGKPPRCSTHLPPTTLALPPRLPSPHRNAGRGPGRCCGSQQPLLPVQRGRVHQAHRHRHDKRAGHGGGRGGGLCYRWRGGGDDPRPHRHARLEPAAGGGALSEVRARALRSAEASPR